MSGSSPSATRRAIRAELALALIALVVAPAARAELSGVVELSDELSVTRSTTAYWTAPVRAGPSGGSATVGRLRHYTEDRFAERYLVLREGQDAYDRTWVRIRLPGRPNGRTGWVLRSALGPYRITRAALVIDRRKLRATYYFKGRKRWSAPVGIGAPGTPTPAGRFWVREQFPVKGDSLYGAYAFGTSAYAKITDWPGGAVVGIHGTDTPELIPGRPSHGCVRLRDADVLWLSKRLPDGAPVRIV